MNSQIEKKIENLITQYPFLTNNDCDMSYRSLNFFLTEESETLLKKKILDIAKLAFEEGKKEGHLEERFVEYGKPIALHDGLHTFTCKHCKKEYQSIMGTHTLCEHCDKWNSNVATYEDIFYK